MPAEETDGGCQEVALDDIPQPMQTAFAEVSGGYLAGVWLHCDAPPETVSLPLDPAFELPAPPNAFTLFDCSPGTGCVAYPSDGIVDNRLTYTHTGEGGPTCTGVCAFAQTRTRSRLPVYVVLCLLFGGIAAIGAFIILYVARQQAMAEQVETVTRV
jgi:hypothetical protein